MYLRKINLKTHHRLPADLVSNLRSQFDYCLKKGKLTESRPGDQRVFFFEEFLDKINSDYIFDQHLDYCESIKLEKPSYMTLMVNKTCFHRDGLGSGAGWHRDGVARSQHKTFFYLSDVNSDNGPFVIHDHSNYLISLLDNPKRRISGELKLKIPDKEVTFHKIVGRSGYSFSCCTNFIHRGLPVITGDRYMLTVYAWNTNPPEPFATYFRR